MDQGTRLIRLGLFGSPVKHSLSPRIHALFARQAGLAVEYSGIESSEEALRRDIQRLAEAGGKGCNITLPLKRRAFQLADQTSERARRAGAANTLVFESVSRWYADNTDGVGLVRDILYNLDLDIVGQRICVLGAGGAAAGILFDILQQGPAAVTVSNRSPQRAVVLAEAHAGLGNVMHAQSRDPAARLPFDLVLNATSAGHERQLPMISRDLFAPGASCYDLNYGRPHQVLRDWCEAQGLACHDGLGMLVEQAAESFRIWTGFEPETAPVIARLRSDLAT
jgi:shikimate dehydrogenase